MKITKSNKKICIFEVNTIDDLSDYFHLIDENFNKIIDIDKAQSFIDKNEILSSKNVRKWYRKFVGSSPSKLTQQFWLGRGYTIIDAKQKVFDIQSKNSIKRFDKIRAMKKSGDTSWKKQFNMNPEFYTHKGYSEEEAARLSHERQVTFSLQKCILDYGEVDGTKIWSERQDKWIATLASKSDAEKFDIKRRKVVPMGRASKASLAIFSPLHKLLIEKQICVDEDVYYGLDERNEWFLADSENFYLYDFCIPKLKLIIEFQGKMWHPDYRLSESELSSWKTISSEVSGEIVNACDDKKKKFAQSHGFNVVYLWETDDVKTNMKIAFDAIIEAISNTPIEVPISSIEKFLETSTVAISSPDGFNKVTQFHVKTNKNLYQLLLSDGRRLTCSDDHYIRLSTGQWSSIHDFVAAPDATYSHLEISTDTGDKAIIAITKMGVGTVNDVTVDHPEHFYYANGITSHNTGKTLLALAAGLSQIRTFGDTPRYGRMIVTRSAEPVGKDLGFLPGTLFEKMDPWLSPIKDNLNFLCSKGKKKINIDKDKRGLKNGQNAGLHEDPYFSLMMDNGLIEVVSITHIRGRSIPDAFVIIDEAQNLTLHELKTIVTRVGEGTKIILLGDCEQIDNHRLDAYSNGLSIAVEKFKSSPLAGHVTMRKGERSALATEAAKLL